MSSTKKVIVIDGLIGSGKTTILNSLSKLLNDKGIKTMALIEPVEDWKKIGALEHFYKDIKQNCYEFQTYVYITRIKDLLENYNKYKNDYDVFIVERSIFSDRYIFVEMLKEDMGTTRMKMYDEWCDLWKKLIPFEFNMFILLDTTVETSMKRLKIRNRCEELGISDEYQTNLRNTHLNFYKNVLNDLNYPKIIINKEIMELKPKEIGLNIIDNLIKENIIKINKSN